jgi:uncharacterized protein (TIGR02271 family)
MQRFRPLLYSQLLCNEKKEILMRDETKQNKNKLGDANRDPITGAAGSHPVGTGLGAAAGGAATGAVVGSVAGPVGTAAGIVGGAVIGGLAGKGIAEAIDPTVEDAYWREHHSKQWFARNRGYEDYSSAYRTGYEGYGRYGKSGKTFDETEADLRQDYERNRGASPLAWDEARDASRAAWHKVQGRWERLIEYEIQDQKSQKIGAVHNLWTDENGVPTFLGVKTGWIFGKNHVVPVHTATVNDRQRIVRLPFSEEKIKEAPTFDADCELTDADEERIYAYYGLQRPQFGAEQTAEAQPRQPSTAGQERATMRLSEEQVKVGKREVMVGGVRLRKVIRTEMVQQPVELKREEVVIERVPASGAQTGQASFEPQDVFIPLRREEAVIQKEARVREEVRVHKEASSDQQTISEQVRKEDVEIEKEGEARFAPETGKTREGTPRYEPKERGKR